MSLTIAIVVSALLVVAVAVLGGLLCRSAELARASEWVAEHPKTLKRDRRQGQMAVGDREPTELERECQRGAPTAAASERRVRQRPSSLVKAR